MGEKCTHGFRKGDIVYDPFWAKQLGILPQYKVVDDNNGDGLILEGSEYDPEDLKPSDCVAYDVAYAYAKEYLTKELREVTERCNIELAKKHEIEQTIESLEDNN